LSNLQSGLRKSLIQNLKRRTAKSQKAKVRKIRKNGRKIRKKAATGMKMDLRILRRNQRRVVKTRRRR